ncbi:lipid droplet-associated protein [Gordonia rhizosphera]|uniref:Lipid droplet-associated protein n=1 Tax=Gordonia rhizosphera NBRC 16068 TaxID=1108045 RepID=K6V1P7_9ACTN|nr:lipid droplet-associated protein [Gordonia rhizosphera]GAB89838.1 hypothetical protein GORHZ_072_00140 [Gordonia rhizosphera NBRC 16068]
MVRAPYPARVAAGLVVTAIEETRKLPALVITLPMTAVSQTLQAGMRLQQNIAELAIKGDLVLESLFDKPSEQPSWAHFDEDDTLDAEADRTPIESRSKPAVIAPTPVPPVPKPAAAPKRAAKPKPAAAPKPSDTAEPSTPDAASGRFALYSSPPEDLVAADGAPAQGKGDSTGDGAVPEIVEELDYDNLTLAQLRAKLRTVGLDALEQLSAYEKSTKARAPFLTMIDNRIASQNSKRQPTT